MNWRRYRFHTLWRVAATPDDLYRVLSDVPRYRDWWPEVRDVAPFDLEAFRLTIRSFLPYDLRFVLRREVEDPHRRLLRAALRGDLDGYSQWTVRGDGSRSLAVFEEEVLLQKEFPAPVALLARPAFVANHAAMMRNGERGVRAFVAGFAAGHAAARSIAPLPISETDAEPGREDVRP